MTYKWDKKEKVPCVKSGYSKCDVSDGRTADTSVFLLLSCCSLKLLSVIWQPVDLASLDTFWKLYKHQKNVFVLYLKTVYTSLNNEQKKSLVVLQQSMFLMIFAHLFLVMNSKCLRLEGLPAITLNFSLTTDSLSDSSQVGMLQNIALIHKKSI